MRLHGDSEKYQRLSVESTFYNKHTHAHISSIRQRVERMYEFEQRCVWEEIEKYMWLLFLPHDSMLGSIRKIHLSPFFDNLIFADIARKEGDGIRTAMTREGGDGRGWWDPER